MTPELIDRIEEAIEPLAEAAGRGAEYAWEVLIRQVILSGAAYIVGALAAGVVAATFVAFTRRVYLHWQAQIESGVSSFDRDPTVFGLVALIAASLITIAATFSFLTAGVMRLLNPGYYALEQLARVVGA